MPYDRRLSPRLEHLLMELRRVEKDAVRAGRGGEFDAYAAATGMMLLRPGPAEMPFAHGEIDQLAHLGHVEISDRRGNSRSFGLTDEGRSIADEHLL